MAQLTSLNLGGNFIGVAGAGWQEEARESGEYLRRRFVPQCRVVVNGTTLGTGPAMHGELVASESDFGLLKPQQGCPLRLLGLPVARPFKFPG
jgi:hypothetical protein